MLPDNRASSLSLGSFFMAPDTFVTTPVVDWERGGVALNDASQGLQVKNWRAWYDDVLNRIFVQGDGETDVPIALFDAPQTTEISLAFDQNMRWSIAYVQAGVLKLNWFDSAANARVTSTFGEARNPKLSLDDKRPTQLALSDVIMGYMRGTSLYYRQQRDRFQTEYLLRSNIAANLKLKNIGLGKNLRLLFEMVLIK